MSDDTQCEGDHDDVEPGANGTLQEWYDAVDLIDLTCDELEPEG